MKDTMEAWEALFHEHRGTEMGVLCAEALRLGLKKGTITGDDLRHIEVINGNVRGAVFKQLRRGGMFAKVGFTASKAEGRNGSAIGVWELQKPVEARSLLNRFAGVCGKVERHEEQMSFC